VVVGLTVVGNSDEDVVELNVVMISADVVGVSAIKINRKKIFHFSSFSPTITFYFIPLALNCY